MNPDAGKGSVELEMPGEETCVSTCAAVPLIMLEDSLVRGFGLLAS